MAAFSNYLENKLIDVIFRSGTFTTPTHIYIALCTSAPTAASTGSTIVEPSGNGYARLQYDSSSSSHWEATQGGVSGSSSGTSGLTSNHDVLTFPTATGSWGVITHVAIVDASTAGAVLFWGALTTSKTVNNGDVFDFLANQLSVTLS